MRRAHGGIPDVPQCGVSLPAVAHAMRSFRLDTVRRLVAAIVLAALGTSLVPAVGAQARRRCRPSWTTPRRSRSRSRPRVTPSGADPLVVFAEAYAAVVGDVSAEALVQLLGPSSLAGVPPAGPR